MTLPLKLSFTSSASRSFSAAAAGVPVLGLAFAASAEAAALFPKAYIVATTWWLILSCRQTRRAPPLMTDRHAGWVTVHHMQKQRWHCCRALVMLKFRVRGSRL